MHLQRNLYASLFILRKSELKTFPLIFLTTLTITLMTAQQHLAIAQQHLIAASQLMTSAQAPKQEYACIVVDGQHVTVLDHARTLYKHNIAGWIDDQALQDVDQVEIAPEDFYLVRWKNTRRLAVVFPADSNHDQWRCQGFDADAHLEAFLRSKNAWS